MDIDATITVKIPYQLGGFYDPYFCSLLERSCWNIYKIDAIVMWKGLEYKYDKILGLLKIIDLSSNNLSIQQKK